MSAEDVHDDACAKLGEIVDSENGIRVLREDVVEARLVLHQVIHARSILQRPFHVRHQSSQGKPAPLAFGEHLLDQGQHGGLVEVTAAQIGFLPDRKSTRLNSSHGYISYAVFCLKKKKINAL